MIYDNILKTIGNTPISRIKRIARNCPAEILGKLEFMNPGGSIKDRLGAWLIEDAEKRGVLKPGGTIIEGTSGNTGFGLAITSAIKGYQCIFVLPDKMSLEKIQNLRAFGAKVIVTPTAVEPDDPRSYYSVCRQLAKVTPNSIYIDQYNNLANRECHYNTTGPEILRDVPDIDVFIAGIGTGGTICGVGRYLKEKKPDVKVIAVDPEGSIVYDYFKTGKMVPAESYLIEGIGEDFIPKNYDFKYVDDIVRVKDQESFLMTRKLLTQEGIYSGVSSGAALVGALRWIEQQGSWAKGKKVVVMFPDSGNRYLSKVYNDDWMREAGFLSQSVLGTVSDLLDFIRTDSKIITALETDPVATVIQQMKEKGISQLPVTGSDHQIKGVITESFILNAIYEGRAKPSDSIEKLIDPSVELVKSSDSVEKISRLVQQGKHPLVIREPSNEIIAIITKIDLLTYLGSRK